MPHFERQHQFSDAHWKQRSKKIMKIKLLANYSTMRLSKSLLKLKGEECPEWTTLSGAANTQWTPAPEPRVNWHPQTRAGSGPWMLWIPVCWDTLFHSWKEVHPTSAEEDCLGTVPPPPVRTKPSNTCMFLTVSHYGTVVCSFHPTQLYFGK